MSRSEGPPSYHLLAKPTGAICNLDCSYCFYLDKEDLYPGAKFRMSDEVLEAYIRQLIESHRTRDVTVAWQGGEPTLLGVDFFRRAVALQEKHRRPGMTFHNTIQTNGTLLDDEWCELFVEHDYLVGISIDGPRDVHDRYRVDKTGAATFDAVLAGLRLLQEYGVSYNVLTTVHRGNASRPLDVYHFLVSELGCEWLQLIPIVERLDEDGKRLYQRGSTVSDRSVTPEEWGRFLVSIFDRWVRNDVGRVFVQTFEAALANWAGLPSSGMCVFDETCGLAPAIEHNGDLYSCDHFVEPDYRLGNLSESSLAEMMASERQRQFGSAKLDALPRYCLDCDVRFACHGECPKNRFLHTPDGEPGLNYLCAGYKAFFHHIDGPMRVLTELLRQGRPTSEVMSVMAEEDLRRALALAGRNDPCPCGSGRKFKKCHGRSR